MKLEYDRRYIFALIIFFAALFYIIPVGVPVKPTEYERAYFNIISRLGEGDVVLMPLSCTFGTWPSIEYGWMATVKFLMSRKVGMVFLGTHNVDETILLENFINKLRMRELRTYGKDFVNFGWIAGGAPMIAALGRDVKSIMKVDIYGNGLEKLPLMNKLSTGKDFSCIIGGWGMVEVIGQLTEVYGVPTLWTAAAMNPTEAANYYKLGLVKGYTVDVQGGLVMENLTGFPGEASMSVTVTSVTQLLIVLATVAGNLYYFAVERKRQG